MSDALSHISIQQGRETMFSHFDTGGEMWTGSGPRSVSRTIVFDEPFAATPMVTVSSGMWDVGSYANLRAEIEAESVTERGCTLVFRTWGDTQIARIRADWMAIGAAVDPSVWSVD